MSELIVWLGALVVLIAAMTRFNNPQTLLTESSDHNLNWLDHVKLGLSWSSNKQNLLLRPPRANTTIFRFFLHQFLYALLATLVYLLILLQPDISDQFQVIMGWFVSQGLPDITGAGPLVIAAFVVLVLPNVPPFRWADITIRAILYERAMIPAQQLREVNRLKIARYTPDTSLVERVRENAVAENFHSSDIVYNSQYMTTQSLWSKCLLLIESINVWEADDHYKAAFAVLKEPDSEKRSVDVVKEIQQNLVADARVCFEKLRKSNSEKNEELTNREEAFRLNCRDLLKKIYSLLAGISLHSHYSDNDRITQFGKLGFHLKAKPSGPIPNSNDMLILTIILSTVIVIPLAQKLGLIKAIMIGIIMFSAVLSPIVLARLCPKMCDGKLKQHGPNVVYPLLAGLLAVFVGFLVFFLGGQFLNPTEFCAFTGYERYINCSYPWSFLHGGIAMLLAIRLGTGKYPDVSFLQGWQRYRQWGDFKDAIICLVCMLLITAFIVIPLLETLRPDRFQGGANWIILMRIGLVSFILGFVVPTWYRAQKKSKEVGYHRKDLDKRERFKQKLALLQQGVQHE